MLNILLIIISSLIAPNWLLLIIAIPFVRLLSYQDILPSIYSIEGADIYLFDIILLIIIVKVFFPILTKRHKIILFKIYPAISYFLSSLLIATIIGYFKFGEKVFIGEMVSFLRFLSQVSISFLLAESLMTVKDVFFSNKLLEYIGYVIAGFIYLNMYLFGIGTSIGEVQDYGGIVRYFGILGDSVGYVLLFFIIKQILSKNIFGIIFFVGALVATGTRGPIIALIISLLFIIIYNYKLNLNPRKLLISISILLIFTGIFYFSDLGGIRTRVVESTHWDSGLKQRLLTMRVATQVFADNSLFGVGYTGFRYIAEKYNAEGMFRLQKGDFTTNYTATANNQFLQVATDGGLLALFSFLWLMRTSLFTLKSAKHHASADRKDFFEAGYLWLLTLLIGAQTACWMLPSSLISYLLWIILGSALASIRLAIPSESRNLRQVPKIIYQTKSI